MSNKDVYNYGDIIVYFGGFSDKTDPNILIYLECGLKEHKFCFFFEEIYCQSKNKTEISHSGVPLIANSINIWSRHDVDPEFLVIGNYFNLDTKKELLSLLMSADKESRLFAIGIIENNKQINHA